MTNRTAFRVLGAIDFDFAEFHLFLSAALATEHLPYLAGGLIQEKCVSDLHPVAACVGH